jgi:hypothetical protein
MTVEQRFTDLPSTASAQLTDIICAVQGYVSPTNIGTSVQETLQQIYNLFQTNLILYNAGNPNGTLAGTTYQLCWDTTDKILWVCTTTGIVGVAHWTPCFGNLTDGQMIIGSTAGVPAPATLTAGANISITNASNSITIAATGIPGVSWTNVSGASQLMVADGGYVANNAGLVTLTLPATAAFGTVLYIIGKGSGGWTIAQNAGQNIEVGSSSSTVGAGGSIASTNQFDSITLVCTTANTTWTALGAPQSAGLTIV